MSIVSTIRSLLGKPEPMPVGAYQAAAAKPPTSNDHLRNIEQNIRALTSILDAESDMIVLSDTVDVGGVVTAVEIRTDRIHLQDTGSADKRLVKLDETLEAYQQMDEELRYQLARKIARLIPDLATSKKKMVLDHTVKVLKMIAQDQTDRVRRMIAEELCELPYAPYDVVRDLAWDPSYSVAAPILEFSPLLRDADLIEIIATSSVPGVSEAIARRSHVSQAVGDAIVKGRQPLAIRALLSNDSAQISTQSMDLIIRDAPNHEIWHESLVTRPELTQKTINRIAGFVSQSLMMQLQDEGRLDDQTKKQAAKQVNKRLNSWTAEQYRAAELRVRQLYELGKLDEEMISNAIHEVDEPFVVASLAMRAQIPLATVKRILKSQNAKVITALAWEAHLAMRTATALQIKIGRVPHTKLLHARGGTDYPLSRSEMQTFLGIYLG